MKLDRKHKIGDLIYSYQENCLGMIVDITDQGHPSRFVDIVVKERERDLIYHVRWLDSPDNLLYRADLISVWVRELEEFRSSL